MEGADLRGAKLDGARLARAFIAETRLAHTDLTAVDLTQVADLARLIERPTGDEVAYLSAPIPERIAIAGQAVDALTRLYAALALRQALTPAQAHRMQGRIRALRKVAGQGR